MKLSELAKKLGLPVTATEAEINTALDTAVTRANEAVKLTAITAKWKGRSITVPDVLELANAASVENPKMDLPGGSGQCDTEHNVIAQLQAQIAGTDTSLGKANEALAQANAAKTAAEARATKAEADVVLANAKVTKAETDKTAAEAKAKTAETTLANAKHGIAKATVSAALKGNQILFAEKDAKEAELANSADIAAAVTTILSGPVKLNTVSKVTPGRKQSALTNDPKSASNKFRQLVNGRYEKEKAGGGNAYDRAFKAVREEHPELISGMEAEKPAPKQ